MTPEQQAALDRAKRSRAIERARANRQGEAPGRLEAGIRGLNQGLTFGFGDEIAAALTSVSRGMSYEDALAYQRGQDSAAREAAPVTTGGAEIAGGIGATLGAAPAALLRGGASMLGRIGLGAGTGAVEGAAYGAGTAEGGLQDRAEGAATGAAIGGVAGGALSPVSDAIGMGVNAVREPVSGALGLGSERRARRVLVERMRRAGLSPDEIIERLKQAQRDGQGEFTTADAMGYEGQRTLSALARRPGDTRQGIVDQLDARQAGQGQRVAGALSDALGGADTAAERTGAMQAQRGEVANRLYDGAREGAQPVDVRGALGAIDRRIGPMEGSGVRGDGIDARLSRYRDRLAARRPPEGESARELSDFDRVLGVKQDLQDDIGAAVRAGRNNEARELGLVMRELDGALEGASPDYRAANDRFAADSRAIGQVEQGQRAARPSSRPEDTVRAYEALPAETSDIPPAGPGQVSMEPRAAFRTGYGESEFARIARGREGANAAAPFATAKSRAEMDAMARDPGLFRRRMDREQTMFETRRQATGGSLTANNQTDNADLEGQEIGTMFRTLANAANLRFGDVATTIAQAAQGQNEGTRQLLAKALMSDDPAPFLAQIPQEERQRVFQALAARAAARQPAIRDGVNATR